MKSLRCLVIICADRDQAVLAVEMTEGLRFSDVRCLLCWLLRDAAALAALPGETEGSLMLGMAGGMELYQSAKVYPLSVST